MFRNPRWSKDATTLEPTNPLAPVTRMRSSRPMMKSSFSTLPGMPPLVSDIGSLYRTNAQEREKPAEMVAQFDRVRHETTLTQDQRQRQNCHVGRNSDKRLCHVLRSERWVLQRVCSAEQSSS